MADSKTPERQPVGVERRTRNAILAGTILLFVGIALAVSDDGWGRWFTVAGILVLFATLHRFGRLGADAS
jgi:fatty acid desaturase